MFASKIPTLLCIKLYLVSLELMLINYFLLSVQLKLFSSRELFLLYKCECLKQKSNYLRIQDNGISKEFNIVLMGQLRTVVKTCLFVSLYYCSELVVFGCTRLYLYYCYKLIQLFRVTCFIAGQYNTGYYGTFTDVI